MFLVFLKLKLLTPPDFQVGVVFSACTPSTDLGSGQCWDRPMLHFRHQAEYPMETSRKCDLFDADLSLFPQENNPPTLCASMIEFDKGEVEATEERGPSRWSSFKGSSETRAWVLSSLCGVVCDGGVSRLCMWFCWAPCVFGLLGCVSFSVAFWAGGCW